MNIKFEETCDALDSMIEHCLDKKYNRESLRDYLKKWEKTLKEYDFNLRHGQHKCQK